MRVGIYNEPSSGGIGGSEISAAVLAEALSNRHQVEIVHHKPYMNSRRLAEISNTDLSAVQMRYLAAEPYSFGSGYNPVRRYGRARGWGAALSKPYDLFINFTHGFPPFCHAGKGALIVLFPFHSRPHQDAQDLPVNNLSLLKRLKASYHDWEWQMRLSTYQIKTTISRFSQEWTSRRWGVDCEIIHPPADVCFQPGKKTNVILSVGRFTATGHSKKQLEMMAAATELQRSGACEMEYYCAGGVSDAPEDLEYLQSVSRAALMCRAHMMVNIDRRRLKQLYQEAKVFWHAAGYGERDECPELSEHFGMATVEAMSAGCVPIVINKGGQSEIVQHGVNGFLWNTLDQLREYTELVMRDERLRAEMSKAARVRAAEFSRERFLSRFLPLLEE